MKTHDSEENAVALPIHLDMLERLRKLCMTKSPDDFLFTDKKGNAFTESVFSYKFVKAANAAGMSNVRLYRALKHPSLSSMAFESGDLYNTSKMARHSRTAMTEKHYARKLSSESNQQSADDPAYPC